MASEWPVVPLGDVINLKRGYDLAARDREDGSVPIISSSGPTGKHSKAMVDPPGVVTGRYGTIGLVHYVEEPYWPLNTTLYVQDFKGNEPRFVYYLLKTIRYSDYLDKAAVPGINRNDVHRAQVYLPPISEQKAIAHTMRCIDERMESLQEQNTTLEAIARAIFKSWFVDFDPVRAKAEGREPEGMDAATAALFPNEFQNSSIGLIPTGWTARKVEEIAERVAMGPFGSSIKVETFVPSGVPVISGQHLRTFMLEDNSYNFISEEHAQRLARASVSPGDIIFTHAGNIGNVSIIPRHARYSRYVLSQRQFFMRCDESKTSANYVALYFTSAEGKHRLLANASSVGVPSIARPVTYLRSIDILVPDKRTLNAFDEAVDPMLESIQHNRTRIETLSAIRDTLLPRLISGKLRVPEAEAMLGKVL